MRSMAMEICKAAVILVILWIISISFQYLNGKCSRNFAIKITFLPTEPDDAQSIKVVRKLFPYLDDQY